jgi:hypothetical protein
MVPSIRCKRSPFAILVEGLVRAGSIHSTAVIVRPLYVAAVILAVKGVAVAQNIAPSPNFSAVDTSSPIFAHSSKTPTQDLSNLEVHARPVSPTIASEISIGIPTYKAEPSSTELKSEATDPQTSDRPKNQIPRLPAAMMQKYFVRESRIPIFRVRDLYTTAGLIDLSFKEHPGLHFGNFFNLNATAAYNKIINEQLYAARLDLADTAFAMAIGEDTKEIEPMQQAIIADGFNRESPAGK